MTEMQLLFVVLAYNADYLDLAQLGNACRAWSQNKSQPIGDLLVEWRWLTTEQRAELHAQVERKLKKRSGDVSATLSALADGAVRDVFQEIDDSDIRESLSSWPNAGHVLVETLQPSDSEKSEATSRYTLTSLHGTGGLGRVWIAYDRHLNREVALKELRPDKGESQDRDIWRRFLKEAQITGQLQHPSIVPVHDVISGDGSRPPVYVMKLVRGRTLLQAIREYHSRRRQGTINPLDLPNLLQAFQSVCQAIAYAHDRGVIHRDLKPANIVLGDYGEVIVLDWGEAKLIEDVACGDNNIKVTDNAKQLSETHDAVGTPSYLAPEQAQAILQAWDQQKAIPQFGELRSQRSFGSIDFRTDVYNLGGTLFEILTGQPPHIKDELKGMVDLLLRIFGGNRPLHPRDRLSEVPDELDAICAKSLSPRPEDRFQTVQTLRTALFEFLIHGNWRPRDRTEVVFKKGFARSIWAFSFGMLILLTHNGGASEFTVRSIAATCAFLFGILRLLKRTVLTANSIGIQHHRSNHTLHWSNIRSLSFEREGSAHPLLPEVSILSMLYESDAGSTEFKLRLDGLEHNADHVYRVILKMWTDDRQFREVLMRKQFCESNS